jgi:copper chaperone NosL
MSIDRRFFIKGAIAGAGLLYLAPKDLAAAVQCKVQHPFMPPNKEWKGQCSNCGMKHAMWGRTWHTFESNGSKQEVCSIHCLAEASSNAGITPENIMTTIYHSPEQSLPATKATYVVGSQARGTMSMKSKLAFATEKDAADFARQCGGEAVSFEKAYAMALENVAMDNGVIKKNRLKKGKIIEPVEGKDVCPVCGMEVAKYQKNKCQLHTSSGQVVHFCATQCLFEFLKNPAKFEMNNLVVKTTWVTDYETGEWIYAKNAFYVLGSTVAGPMGKEAFPFAARDQAEKFSRTYTGRILRFHEVTIDKILV